MSALSGDMSDAVDHAVDALSGGSGDPAPSSGTPTAPDPTPGRPDTPGAPSADPARAVAGSAASTIPASAAPVDPDADLLSSTRPIPVARVKAALQNAREKVAKETEAKVRQELSALYGIDADTWTKQELSSHVRAILERPAEYVLEMGRALRQGGILTDEQIQRGLLGRAPNAPAAGGHLPAAPHPAAADLQEPDADLQLEDGTEVFSRTALQKYLQWFRAGLLRDLQPTLEPLQAAVHGQRLAEINANAQTWARQQFDEAQKWPGFASIRQDVADLMRRDQRYSLEGAYWKVFREKHLPSLESEHRRKFNDELQKAPAAPDQVAPGTAQTRGSGGTGRRRKAGADWDSAIANAMDAAGR